MVKNKKKSHHVIFSNNISIPMRNKKINELSNRYDEETKLISDKVSNIIDLIHRTDPFQLMNFLVTTDYFANVMMGSEIEYTNEQILQSRAIEYIQSLLVSKAVETDKMIYDENEQEAFFYKIQTETIDLYNAVQQWYYYWAAYAEKVLKLDAEDIDYIVESQMFSQVRGKRYQFQVEEHLRTLINPLNDLLKKSYNISSNEVIEGLLAIEFTLTRGRGEALSRLQDIMSIPDNNRDNPTQELIDEGRSLFDNLFGTAANNVEKITNWPKNFIEKLSYSIGECDNFSNQQYNFWPILSLPIQRKPFMKIKDTFFCFSYYNLFDNIYRMLQKLLIDFDIKNKDAWEQIQKETSEEAIASIFSDLLPGCEVFRDNYYPEKQSLKRMNENDIIIKYENSLFIVEVKAGSFSPIPALINNESHLKSYKSLVEKADQQCQRTIDYLNRNNDSPIYGKDKRLKEVFKMGQYNYVYTICVTIDDFNEFAAKAEKLNSINIAEGTIVMSIEDLRTYKDYFESPFIFLNYFENRKNATKVEALRLNDELDHLGMYIQHNMYPKTVIGGKKNSVIQAWGYRQELDEYFISLWSDEYKERPERNVDSTILQMLSLLGEKPINDKISFSNFLLDFSSEGAQRFSNSILSLQRRQQKLNRMLPMIGAGEGLRYVLFIEQPEIEFYSFDGMLKYCDGMLVFGKYSSIMLIRLEVDSKGRLIDLWFEERKIGNIPPEELDNLTEYGRKTFNTRVKSMLRVSGKKKIGRNDYCPCGSGLKYKNCCGV